ncbi:MAG: helix-turn-helix transcriptional regulator [Clostridiales bacterium]|nr:helix-turn-helix transcriptional regulator [Clostridiales bacterium]
MEMIAVNIARLRRERGWTQENLAEMIGVAAQTISKWENSTTCPDVALLPVIADVFGVTIDALYGREEAQCSVTPDAAIEQVIERVRETIVGLCWEPERDRSFAEELAQYKKVMKLDERHRSVVENDRDVLYFREKLGALALRKPEEGWSSLFAPEDTAALLRLLADEDFRRAMQLILKKRLLTFTMPSLARQSGVADADGLENSIRRSGLFARRELMIDEAPLTYYELVAGESKLFLLFAVLAFAAEYASHQSVHYCFFGNMNYFTP